MQDVVPIGAGGTYDKALFGHLERRGLVFDRWPFRLDLDEEYQSWILGGTCVLIVGLWSLPCFCGYLQNSASKAFAKWVYTRLHVFYWTVAYVSLILLMCTLLVLPDWSMSEFLIYLGLFLEWVLQHLVSMIKSVCIIFAFWMVYKFRERILIAARLDHITVLKWDFKDPFGFRARRRPVEVFIWKVEDLQSSGSKLMKANDVFIECHLGDNEPMRTRVHNNAGSSCTIKESFQLNLNESRPHELMTILLKDQSLVASRELARVVLSAAELCGIEDQTGKRRCGFEYKKECFVSLTLSPMGRVWIAIAPVEDRGEEEIPLMEEEDALITC